MNPVESAQLYGIDVLNLTLTGFQSVPGHDILFLSPLRQHNLPSKKKKTALADSL